MKHEKRHFLLLTTILFALAFFIVLLLLYLCVAALIRHSQRGCSFSAEPVAAFLHGHHLEPPVFTYDQLCIATEDFDPIRKIGDGGFGSVYLAEFCDGSFAAVKRIHQYQPEAALAATITKSFYNEIVILSSLRHPNLVRLHGYCVDPRGLLLVYDYVPNGTLAEHLHGFRRTSPGLSWYVRVDIALQTAMALEYLHFGLKPPVVHRDVTSTNIFVESDMQVRLGDFGLSRLLTSADACSTSVSRELICCTGPQGTPGYLDPEYHRSFRLTEKSDVYSFGVVLLELVTGMRAVDVSRDRREIALADYIVGKIQQGQLWEVIDPVLVPENVMASIEAVAELAFRCVAGDKDDRPNAGEIIEELSRIKGKLSEALYHK
jgi:serine/threonine protein kinase